MIERAAIKKEKAVHAGLAAASLVLACWIILARDSFDFLAVVAIIAVGGLAYSVAYIYLLNSLEEILDFFEEEPDHEIAEPAAVSLEGGRIIVNGKLVHVPTRLTSGIHAILRSKEAGELDTISARAIHNLGIASRYTNSDDETSAQELLDWLIEQGVVEQKPQQAGEWIGSVRTPPTRQEAIELDRRYRSTTATTTTNSGSGHRPHHDY